MSDLIAAILGELSSIYSQKKIGKFFMSLIASGVFFLGCFIADIFGHLIKSEEFSFVFIIDLVKGLILFSLLFFLICYAGLFILEKIEKRIKSKK